MMPVPNGLSPEVAVLTEPLLIGHHAVNRSEITKKDAAVVIGCGPVGLAIICLLKTMGIETIVASDYSPGRRAWPPPAAPPRSSIRPTRRPTTRSANAATSPRSPPTRPAD